MCDQDIELASGFDAAVSRVSVAWPEPTSKRFEVRPSTLDCSVTDTRQGACDFYSPSRSSKGGHCHSIDHWWLTGRHTGMEDSPVRSAKVSWTLHKSEAGKKACGRGSGGMRTAG